MTLTQIKPAGLSKPVDLADNEKIRLGTGNDLQIYHDGANTGIINSTGGLYIRNNGAIFLETNNGESSVKCVANDNVELYFDNAKKLQTTSGGIYVTGDIDAGDGSKIKLGGGDDLQFFHNGSDSIIRHGNAITGNDLYIQSDTKTIFGSVGGAETHAVFNDDGAVELYYNNSKKLETASHGVSINGNLDFPDNTSGNASLRFGNSQDFFMNHNGSDSYIINNTGDLYIRDLNGDVHIQGKDAEESIIAKADGAVELYYDNSKRIETLTEGAKVKRYSGGATTLFIEGAEGGSAILDMYADDGDDIADKFRFNAATDGTFYMQNYANNGWQSNITYTGAGNVELYHNGSKKLETKSTGIEITSALGIANVGGTLAGSGGSENWMGIKDSGGNFQFAVKTAGTNVGGVGIGTTSPTKKLEIQSTTSEDGILIKSSGNNYHTICGDANRSQATDNILRLDAKWNGNVVGRIRMLAGHDTTNKDDGIICFDTDAGSGMGERMRVLSGGGITFNGDTATANALDDYEEGTFSGTASASGYSGGNAIALLDETYTKIGRIVHFNCRLQVASNLSDGDLTLSGLPFTAAQESVVNFSWQDAASFNGGQGKINGTQCVRFNGVFPTHSSGTANIIFSGTYRT